MRCFCRKHKDNAVQSQTDFHIDSRIAPFADDETLIKKFLGILLQPALRNVVAPFVEAIRTSNETRLASPIEFDLKFKL
jgi:hypothetical protein